MAGKIKVTLVKSTIGKKPDHRATVRALGLRKMWRSNIVDSNNPAVAGMIKKVSYMLRVEEVDG
ncbi:MAG: 50S ribosomal protein L30 [Leptonema sp. (in: Bacteria)]|nr:50S ribosomal protein L30 [Leptonema sp. (in: bacteria)]